MTPLPRWRRYARLFGPDPAADARDELHFHLDSKVQDLRAEGWSEDAARVEAARQLGDVQALEAVGAHVGTRRQRRTDRTTTLMAAVQDLRLAFRVFLRDPGYACIVMLVIALGIATNATVFSVVHTLLLRPLPFPEPQALTWLSSGVGVAKEARAALGLSSVTYTVDAFEAFQASNQSFASVAAYNPFFADSDYLLTGQGDARALDGVMVGGNFFQTLGVEPAIGRWFAPDEVVRNGRPAVMLSHALWRDQFGANPDLVGQTITIDRRAVTVVGVLPESFDFGSVFAPGQRFDVFMPAVMDDLRGAGNTLSIVGRMKPGVSVQQAQSEADSLFPRLQREHPEWWGDYSSTVTALGDHVRGHLRRPLIVLWSAVGLLLVMACVNVSSLLLARVSSRDQEFAMRATLGASRVRLFAMLLAESVVLTAAGTALGVALALLLTRWLARQDAVLLPLLDRVVLGSASLWWTAAIAAAMAFVFAVVPMARLSRTHAERALQASGRGIAGPRRLEQLRATLVVVQVALACVLLVGAGLLLRSFVHVLDVDLGFAPSRAAAVEIMYEGGDGARRGVVLRELLDRIGALPGVEAAGVTDMLPLGRNRSWGLRAPGATYRDNHEMAARVRVVTPGYLEAMGMRLREGRAFSWDDAASREPIVIINEAAARRHWPAGSPLGSVAEVTLDGWKPARIVGILADVRGQSVEAAAGPEMYLPVWLAGPSGAELVVRSTMPASTLGPSVLRVLRDGNPLQPATSLRPLQDLVDRSVSPRRFFLLLVGGLAVLGLALAAVGIFGVISYAVKQRTREIGVRMALGANAGQVRRQVMFRSLRLAGLGLAVGAVASTLVARALSSLLFETTPTDPVSYAGVAVLVVALAGLAGYLPARHASRIEPMAALRKS
ncbi:MAG TPA: ABC transporter permease [Luteitalea sp.]|nr:ABC transporter permease [Luteitalea sp.]